MNIDWKYCSYNTSSFFISFVGFFVIRWYNKTSKNYFNKKVICFVRYNNQKEKYEVRYENDKSRKKRHIYNS